MSPGDSSMTINPTPISNSAQAGITMALRLPINRLERISWSVAAAGCLGFLLLLGSKLLH